MNTFLKIGCACFFYQLFFMNSFAQKENKNWYFGTGTDGIVFDVNNNPVKVTNKYPNVGYEGMVVVSDPFTGDLLFYTDGITVINKNHAIMQNGSGLLAHYSCSQGVQACKMPGECKKYYIVSNASVDNVPGNLYYSIADFTTNPLGVITVKNQLIGGPDYHQALRIIPQANSNNFWMVCHLYNTATYHVYHVTPTGFGAPVVYNFNNDGRSYMMVYKKNIQKLVVTGEDNLKATMFDFNDATGVMSNEVQLALPTMDGAWGGNFSPDGTKLYLGITPGFILWQYDFSNSTWTNMNTCCWAHDIKTGPNGITYFIHTYYGANPLAQMTNANLTAVGNACGYSVITNPGNFNGEVRRFPEFLTIPDPPLANVDTVTVSAGSPVILFPLTNDNDPQNDPIAIDSILYGPLHGTYSLNNNQFMYKPDSGFCNGTDTVIYRISDNVCDYDTAKIIIYIQGYLLNVSGSNALCNGDTITLSSDTIPGAIYSWSGPGSFTSSLQNPVVTNITQADAGYYVLSVNANGCVQRDSVKVEVTGVASADFTWQQEKCSGKIFLVNVPGGANSFLWSFGDGDTSSVISPEHMYVYDGVFDVMLIADPGSNCADTSVQKIEITGTGSSLWVPNAFTPNGDTKNEVFELKGISNCLDFQLTIFNRWGQIVYATDNIRIFWDGTFRNKNVPAGVYYYLLEGGKATRTGHVTVLR